MPDDTGNPDSPKVALPSPATLVSWAHRAGQDVGRLSALAAFRLGEMAAAAVSTSSTSGEGQPSPGDPGNLQPDDRSETSALARADAIVSRAGHRAVAMTAGLPERLARSAALAREAAEDIMADAQELRQRGREDTTHGP